MQRNLYFFLAHIDDFEISCLGYLFKNYSKYDKINVFIASTWEPKKDIWSKNLDKIQSIIDTKINYKNFNYNQRQFNKHFDEIKDDFYKEVDFKSEFDIVTHDINDCHTDHVVCNQIAMGIFKYSTNFTSVYSPSSINFKPNCWLSLTDEQFKIKKECIDMYNIENEQSYTKLGYYMENESFYNIGKSYHMENFANERHSYYETYRILKMEE